MLTTFYLTKNDHRLVIFITLKMISCRPELPDRLGATGALRNRDRRVSAADAEGESKINKSSNKQKKRTITKSARHGAILLSFTSA